MNWLYWIVREASMFIHIVLIVLLIGVSALAGFRYGSVAATEAANVKASVTATVAGVEAKASKIAADIKQ